jgi:hypothetical protein
MRGWQVKAGIIQLAFSSSPFLARFRPKADIHSRRNAVGEEAGISDFKVRATMVQSNG